MNRIIPLKGETLRALQLAELEILRVVATFCDAHGIRYCLSSGTLLGAIRHNGFIPWDDDVDISMPRKDFEHFLALAKELPPPFVVQATRLDSNYPLGMAKVRKADTVMKEPATGDLPINHGIWIDLFPLDKVLDANKLQKRAKTYALLCTAIYAKLGIGKPLKWTTRLLCRLMGLLGVQRLDRWRTRVMTADEDSDAELLTSFASNLGPCNLLFPPSVYFPLKKHVFEGTEFSVPNDTNAWLTGAYGDFMTPPPPKQRVNRHQVSELVL